MLLGIKQRAEAEVSVPEAGPGRTVVGGRVF
jgi:hypothetical protein